MAEYAQALLVLAPAVAIVVTGYVAALSLAVSREPFQALPFLAGGMPTEHAVSRFHVRWYPLPMLFLAFDMEMVFMYPWAVVVGQIGVNAVIEMFLFLSIIMVGVVYAVARRSAAVGAARRLLGPPDGGQPRPRRR